MNLLFLIMEFMLAAQLLSMMSEVWLRGKCIVSYLLIRVKKLGLTQVITESLRKDWSQGELWTLSNLLSHNHQSFKDVLSDQTMSTFINYHIPTFESFWRCSCNDKYRLAECKINFPEFISLDTVSVCWFLAHYWSLHIKKHILMGQNKEKVDDYIK